MKPILTALILTSVISTASAADISYSVGTIFTNHYGNDLNKTTVVRTGNKTHKVKSKQDYNSSHIVADIKIGKYHIGGYENSYKGTTFSNGTDISVYASYDLYTLQRNKITTVLGVGAAYYGTSGLEVSSGPVSPMISLNTTFQATAHVKPIISINPIYVAAGVMFTF